MSLQTSCTDMYFPQRTIAASHAPLRRRPWSASTRPQYHPHSGYVASSHSEWWRTSSRIEQQMLMRIDHTDTAIGRGNADRSRYSVPSAAPDPARHRQPLVSWLPENLDLPPEPPGSSFASNNWQPQATTIAHPTSTSTTPFIFGGEFSYPHFYAYSSLQTPVAMEVLQPTAPPDAHAHAQDLQQQQDNQLHNHQEGPVQAIDESLDHPPRKRSHSAMAEPGMPTNHVPQPYPALPGPTDQNPFAPQPQEQQQQQTPPNEQVEESPRTRTIQRGDPPTNDNGKFICLVEAKCMGITFDRKCEWSKHMDKHDRPYRCSHKDCVNKKGFTYSGGLLRHEREVHGKHGGPKQKMWCPYPECKRAGDESFTRKENYLEHLRRVHGDKNATPPDQEPPSRPSDADHDDDAIEPALKRRAVSNLAPNEGIPDDVEELKYLVRSLQASNAEKDQFIRQLQAQLPGAQANEHEGELSLQDTLRRFAAQEQEQALEAAQQLEAQPPHQQVSGPAPEDAKLVNGGDASRHFDPQPGPMRPVQDLS